jgi:hypothetical protein
MVKLSASLAKSLILLLLIARSELPFVRLERRRNRIGISWSDEVKFYTGADNSFFWVTYASGKGEE